MKATICPVCSHVVSIDEKGQGVAIGLCRLHQLEIHVNAGIASTSEYSEYKQLLRDRALEPRYPEKPE